MRAPKSFKKTAACSFLALILIISTSFGAGEVLDAVPQESVFCVKINGMDATLGQIDQFAMGLAPMMPSMMIRGQFAQLLGDPQLQGLDTTGDVGIFGMPIKKENGEHDMFVAFLLPVKDYGAFVSLSPSISEPDAAGISKVANQPVVAIKAGSYALLGEESQLAKLTSITKNVSSITKTMDADQKKLSGEMPIWAYADIERLNAEFGEDIQKALAEMKKEMNQQLSQQPGMEKMGQMMDIYIDMVSDFLEQGKYANVSLKPEATVLRVHKILAAKPGTDMASLLTADESLPKTNKLAGLMEDDAAVNVAAKFDSKSMEKMGELGMSFYKYMMSEDEAAKWEKVMNDGIAAMGNNIMMTCKADAASKPPFAFKYAVEIKDKAKYQKSVDEGMKLVNDGAFAEMYKEMGMVTKFDLQKSVSTYKEVSIDKFKYSIEITDTNSPEAMMMKQMYGDGIEYLMAVTDKYFVTVIGSDKETAIKSLIDSVSSGQAAAAPAVDSALGLIEGSEGADMVGTINIIKTMQMVMGFMPMPMPIPFDQIPTSSNIAFTAKADSGKMVADVAVPKQHLQELMQGMQMLMMQKMQQQQQMQGQPQGQMN